MPTKAGGQGCRHRVSCLWVPAFAGTTKKGTATKDQILTDRIAASEATPIQLPPFSCHTGPRVHAARGPGVNSARYRLQKWGSACAGMTVWLLFLAVMAGLVPWPSTHGLDTRAPPARLTKASITGTSPVVTVKSSLRSNPLRRTAQAVEAVYGRGREAKLLRVGALRGRW